jgi:hypothetical protein
MTVQWKSEVCSLPALVRAVFVWARPQRWPYSRHGFDPDQAEARNRTRFAARCRVTHAR